MTAPDGRPAPRPAPADVAPAREREAYAARQAALLDALLRGVDYPEGFVAAKADAAGTSLRRKRGRAFAQHWPALAIKLGAAFDERFDAFARGADGPASGDPLEDGLAFARSLGDGGRNPPFGDDVRVELLLARRAAPPRRLRACRAPSPAVPAAARRRAAAAHRSAPSQLRLERGRAVAHRRRRLYPPPVRPCRQFDPAAGSTRLRFEPASRARLVRHR